MAITIREVAKRLNLSITTVSRALDGYADVAEETRQLVIRTSREMGYTPNRAARQLRRRKSETIGFILPAIAQRIAKPFFMEFIAGMGDELTNHGYDLLVANATTEENERELYQRWIDGKKVDGMILNRVCIHDWRIQFLNDQKIPFSALERSCDNVEYPSIEVDGSTTYFELIEYLREGGFKKLAFIGGPEELVNHVNRLDWVKIAGSKLGLELNPAHIMSTDLTSKGGYLAAKALLSSPTPPDAILCIDDETAFGALHAAHEQGLLIGNTLGIAGFDGSPDSLHTEPALTTLDIPVYDIARELVSMTIKNLSGEILAEPQKKIIPRLLIRESTSNQHKDKEHLT
jgi:LacI family transcriptional regulator, galactose operon repressor